MPKDLHPVLRKLFDYTLLAAAIAAVVGGIEWYRSYELQKGAEAYVQSLAKSARARRPSEGATALHSEATAAAEESLRSLGDNSLRFERAGATFLSAYIPTAEVLPELCAQYGVPIDAFRQTYVALHADALSQAHRRTAQTPLRESELREKYLDMWRTNSANALRQLAESKKSTPKAECTEIESNGPDNAAQMNLASTLPYTYAVLYDRRTR